MIKPKSAPRPYPVNAARRAIAVAGVIAVSFAMAGCQVSRGPDGMNRYVLSSRSLSAASEPTNVPTSRLGEYPSLAPRGDATRADARLVAARLMKAENQGGTEAVAEDIAGCYATFHAGPHMGSMHSDRIRFCVLYDYVGYKIDEAGVTRHHRAPTPFFDSRRTYGRVREEVTTLNIATEQEFWGYLIQGGELVKRLLPPALYLS